jgi:glutathione S-transferase
MKLYDSVGPNPRVVNMFLLEKGFDVLRETVDIIAGENRQPTFLAKNPAGQTPTLELDDGFMINEINAICEYLEEIHPEPVLVGRTPKDRAETRMWVRRIDLYIGEPMASGF